jgi:tRNA G18 (ribose-2'-O)-methylase SpoU
MSKAPDLSMFTKEEIKVTLDTVRHPVSIAIFGSSNYFNAAAIVRSAHQFLVQEIILVDCPDIYERATMGTHKWENITHMTLDEFCKRHSVWSSADNRSLVICERRPDLDSESLLYFSYPKNPILCFGSEKEGIPDELLALAEQHRTLCPEWNSGQIVSIPQYGILNDLNLANAASICLYDWIAKWYTGKVGLDHCGTQKGK